MWLLPITIIVLPIILAIPLSTFMARIMDGHYRPWPILGWFEKRLDSGPQDWKQYTVTLLFFNTVISFATNTDIQHYSGDQAFSNFSQIFFCIPMFFLSAAIGLCALTAIIR